jgi:hypothetical protein
MKSKIIVAAIAVVAVFLIGFVPQYVKANRLEDDLRGTSMASFPGPPALGTTRIF